MATYVVYWIDGGRSVGVRLEPGSDASVAFPPTIPYAYSGYIRATNSSPQFGDKIDVDKNWNILGLTPEWN